MHVARLSLLILTKSEYLKLRHQFALHHIHPSSAAIQPFLAVEKQDIVPWHLMHCEMGMGSPTSSELKVGLDMVGVELAKLTVSISQNALPPEGFVDNEGTASGCTELRDDVAAVELLEQGFGSSDEFAEFARDGQHVGVRFRHLGMCLHYADSLTSFRYSQTLQPHSPSRALSPHYAHFPTAKIASRKAAN
jgi:hypothetical protein